MGPSQSAFNKRIKKKKKKRSGKANKKKNDFLWKDNSLQSFWEGCSSPLALTFWLHILKDLSGRWKSLQHPKQG